MDMKVYFLLQKNTFHCHVSLAEGTKSNTIHKFHCQFSCQKPRLVTTRRKRDKFTKGRTLDDCETWNTWNEETNEEYVNIMEDPIRLCLGW